MKKILDVSHGTLDNNFFEVLLATTRIVQNGSGRFSMDQNVYFRQFDITVQVTHRKKEGWKILILCFCSHIMGEFPIIAIKITKLD